MDSNTLHEAANKKIDSLLTLLGIDDKSEIQEKLSQATFIEFMTVVKGIIANTPSVSNADIKIPTNGQELQSTVAQMDSLLENNGVDLSSEYEKTLNSVLSNFLNDLEGKVDAQVMSNARAQLTI